MSARFLAMQAECLAEALERALIRVQEHAAFMDCTPTVQQVAQLATDDCAMLLTRVRSLRGRIECEVPADVA